MQVGRPSANSLMRIKKAAPQGTKGFCRRYTAAKWFGVVAERLFSMLKRLVWVRGYHGEAHDVKRTFEKLYEFMKFR